MKQVITLIMIGLVVNTSHSQPSITLRGGVAKPILDFGKFSTENELSDYYKHILDFGYAGTGFNLGLTYSNQLFENGLGWYVSFDIIRNGLKKEYTTWHREDFLTFDEFYGTSKPISIKHSSYTNLPLSFGVHYIKPLGESFSLYGNLGLAANTLRRGTYRKEVEESYVYEWDGITEITHYTLEGTYAMTVRMGSQLEVGAILKDRFSIGIRLLGLGNHTTKEEWTYDETQTQTDESGHTTIERSNSSGSSTLGTKRITLVTFNIGIVF